jgi:DNA-binding NarL/FixJ family response regulator
MSGKSTAGEAKFCFVHRDFDIAKRLKHLFYCAPDGSKNSRPMETPRKARVMIVDGMPLTRIGLSTLINNHPRMRVCAETGEARVARQLCAEQQPDLVVLDLVLHRGDGIELLQDFPRLCPAARSLVISEREDALSLQRTFRAGARGYLTKSDDAPEVLAALEHVLEGELFASRRISDLLLGHLSKGRIKTDERGMSTLSNRELQIFRLIGRGLGVTAVARELGVSVKTIETHQQRIKAKLSVATAAELSRRALRWASVAAALVASMCVEFCDAFCWTSYCFQ